MTPPSPPILNCSICNCDYKSTSMNNIKDKLNMCEVLWFDSPPRSPSPPRTPSQPRRAAAQTCCCHTYTVGGAGGRREDRKTVSCGLIGTEQRALFNSYNLSSSQEIPLLFSSHNINHETVHMTDTTQNI